LALLLALAGAGHAEENKAGEEKDLTKGPPPFEALKFRSIGPAAGGRVSRVAGVPGDPNVYYAATASGGVWKSTDGGHTFKPVFDDQPISSIGSIAIAPSDPSVVYVGSGEANIRGNVAAGSGLYVSRDGGESWKALTGHGLPEGTWGKVGLAVAPSDGRRVYALIEAEKGGLFRSDDGGATWSLASDHHALRQRAWYYSMMSVDPRRPDVVWFPQVPLLRTIDGGKTIQSLKGAHHGDHHDVWIDP